MSEAIKNDDQVVDGYVVRLNGRAWGMALGLLFGIGLCLATIILIVKAGDGEEVGQHLGLLNQYLPGYEVTYGGAFLGLIYGFVIGYLVGRLIGGIYSLAARR